MVDELGLKNSSVGQARVSKVHGNFIVNDGGATAAEVLELIERIQRIAREKRGIELETEVQIVGGNRRYQHEARVWAGGPPRFPFLAEMHIAVLKGGPGAERDVSLATGAGVAKALRSLGANVTEVDVRDADFELPADVDLAFIALHGTFGEDGQVQKILEDRGVAYTGRRC